MVRIWVMDPRPTGDLRLPHLRFPPKMVTPEQLLRSTGVKYWKIEMEDEQKKKQRISTILREHPTLGTESIFVCGKEQTLKFDEKLKHLQAGGRLEMEQGSLCVSGSGFWDVEGRDGTWFRIALQPGDFVLVPRELNQRFTTDTKNFIRMQKYVAAA